MKPRFIALAAAIALIALAIFIRLHAPAAPAGGKSGKLPAPASNKEREQVALAIALLPAPGLADAGRPAGDTATGTAAATLAGHAAARDGALAQEGDEFLRKSAEVLRQSPPPTAATLPALSRRKAVSAAATPNLALPIHAGRASLGWISRTVRGEHALPSPNAVRLEEILNGFVLRPIGSAAISKGVSITTECHPCPWQPSASLLLIAIRGATDADCDITATFQADPAAVARYRLLGFAPVSGLAPAALPSRLVAKARTTLAIEIEPSGTAATLGTIEWTLDGNPVASIPITVQLDAEPSDDARFAALVCTFAQWLAHDQPTLIDAELLAALTRETASTTLPPDRADLLALINEALALKGE